MSTRHLRLVTPLPPLEAEQSVLGAILCAGSLDVAAGHKTLDRVLAVGLDPVHFFLASDAQLYAVLIDMRERELPLDPVSVAAELDETHADPRALGRLQVLARTAPAFTPAPRWAEIVRTAGMRRLAT